MDQISKQYYIKFGPSFWNTLYRNMQVRYFVLNACYVSTPTL